MKRNAKTLLLKAVDSLCLSIEHFNRPFDCGRCEATLILMDRSFELLLKAAILHRGGSIWEKGRKQTIGFDTCIRRTLTSGKVQFLKESEAITIQLLNSLRDAAQHYIVEISEEQLYVYAQAGLTLFRDLLDRVFELQLGDFLPERVLPIATKIPKDFPLIIKAEFEEIKSLIQPGRRRVFEAQSRLRALAILQGSLDGIHTQPGDGDLAALVARIRNGETWEHIFPGVAQLLLEPQESGPNLALRITKKDGEAIHLVPEGTPGAAVVAIRRVDELGFYSLSPAALAQKVNLTQPRCLAVVRSLGLKQSSDYFKEIKIGSQRFPRYSAKAVATIKAALPSLNMEKVWEQHGAKRRGGATVPR